MNSFQQKESEASKCRDAQEAAVQKVRSSLLVRLGVLKEEVELEHAEYQRQADGGLAKYLEFCLKDYRFRRHGRVVSFLLNSLDDFGLFIYALGFSTLGVFIGMRISEILS